MRLFQASWVRGIFEERNNKRFWFEVEMPEDLWSEYQKVSKEYEEVFNRVQTIYKRATNAF